MSGYRGGRRDRASLIYETEYYTPEGAKNLTEKELKKEYSRLRSIARKRLERFAGSEWENTNQYKMNKDAFKQLKDIKSDRELRYKLSQVANFVTAKTSTVTGLKQQRTSTIKTLNERGYDFVNKENFLDFTDFMERARVKYGNVLYDSKRIADLFGETVEGGYTKNELNRAFNAFRRENAKQADKIQHKNYKSSAMYRGMF